MLVLTRRVGQAIEIGNLMVWVSKIQGGEVRLAIDAPREVPVRRYKPEAGEKPFTPRHTGGTPTTRGGKP